MRWGLILFKGASAPAVALAGGFLASYFLAALASVDTVGVADLALWSRRAGQAGVAGFCLLYGVFVWRMWRWSEGADPSCQRCMGPLGRLRDGKVYFGRQLADYRKCYNCGESNPVCD